MVKLSTVIITRNEAENIERCIKSVTGVSDEILVVDSHSSDNTAAVCKRLGASVVSNHFEGFVSQKNFALTRAQYDHVLSLDADEALSPEAQRHVREAKANWSSDAYSFKRLNRYHNRWIKHCGWYPDRKTRMFDRRTARWAGGDLHEYIRLPDGARANALNSDILHFPYKSLSHHLEKMNSYTSIAAREISGKSEAYLWFKLISDAPFHFLMSYVVKRGFMDGTAGFIISVLSGYYRFLKYAKALELKHARRND